VWKMAATIILDHCSLVVHEPRSFARSRRRLIISLQR
jgi:hypothetical protein